MEQLGWVFFLGSVPVIIWMVKGRVAENEAKKAGEYWPVREQGNRKMIGGLVGVIISSAGLLTTGMIFLLPAGFFLLSLPAGYIQLNKADQLEREAEERQIR